MRNLKPKMEFSKIASCPRYYWVAANEILDWVVKFQTSVAPMKINLIGQNKPQRIQTYFSQQDIRVVTPVS